MFHLMGTFVFRSDGPGKNTECILDLTDSHLAFLWEVIQLRNLYLQSKRERPKMSVLKCVSCSPA